jgi:hypothetical protein
MKTRVRHIRGNRFPSPSIRPSGWSDAWYNGDFTLYTVYETSTSNDNPITNPSLWFVDIDDLYLLNCNWHRYASDLAAWQ